MPRQLTYTTALRKALERLDQQPVDGAAVRLAHGYAQQLDARGCDQCGGPGDRLDRLGPKLLATLTALGMTPAARAAAVPPAKTPAAEGGASDQHASRLNELRARRARQH